MGIRIDEKGIVRHNGLPSVQVDCALTAEAVTVGAGQIGTTELADLGVSNGKLAANSVTTSKIQDNQVTTAKLAAGAATLPKMDLFTGLKLLAADGVDSSGGNTEVTLTGSAVGDRVVAIFGQIKAETGANSFLIPAIPTHFEGTITVVNKIVQKTAAGNLSANTYLFILAPAAASS